LVAVGYLAINEERSAFGLRDGKINDLVDDFFGRETFREELQVVDALADIRPHLVGEYDTVKWNISALPAGCFREQIVIPGKQDATQ